jgi:hypothetical protein
MHPFSVPGTCRIREKINFVAHPLALTAHRSVQLGKRDVCPAVCVQFLVRSHIVRSIIIPGSARVCTQQAAGN